MAVEPQDPFCGVPSPAKAGHRLFDPVKLAELTERVVCRENKRKYSRFAYTINYGTGIATGYAVGCSLRCVFCWASPTRDNAEGTGGFYSPEEVFERLLQVAEKKGVDQIRVSDGEPTIGKQHLLELLDLAERSAIKRFVLETNGILLGHDPDYVQSLAKYRKIYLRLSLKAGTPEDFSRKTGAVPEAFDLPFQAIRNLKARNVSFRIASMSADPRFMSPLERISLIGKLAEIDPALVLGLEEEVTVLYPDTLKRLQRAGWDPNGAGPSLLRRMPWLSRYLQVTYPRMRSLARQRISVRYSLKAIRELFHGT